MHLISVPGTLAYEQPGELNRVWAPLAFVVSFKLETDELLLLPKAVAALERYGVHAVVRCCGLLILGLFTLAGCERALLSNRARDVSQPQRRGGGCREAHLSRRRSGNRIAHRAGCYGRP